MRETHCKVIKFINTDLNFNDYKKFHWACHCKKFTKTYLILIMTDVTTKRVKALVASGRFEKYPYFFYVSFFNFEKKIK